MLYSPGVESQFIQAVGSNGLPIESIEITEQVRAVSMQTYGGQIYTGMQLFDSDENLINQGIWDSGIDY